MMTCILWSLGGLLAHLVITTGNFILFFVPSACGSIIGPGHQQNLKRKSFTRVSLTHVLSYT
eukprot:jgi/Botrbrau1/19248/Bobra.0073s0001.1